MQQLKKNVRPMFSIAIDVYDNKKNILIKSSRTDVACNVSCTAPYRRCTATSLPQRPRTDVALHRTDVALQRLYNTIQKHKILPA